MCLSQTVLNWELIMSVRPLGAATCSWLSAACPATRAHRYTTTSRHFKVGRELSGWSQKSGDITIVTACGDIVVVVSEAFIPSFCDVFVWRSLLFNVILAMKLRCGNIRVESVLVD